MVNVLNRAALAAVLLCAAGHAGAQASRPRSQQLLVTPAAGESGLVYAVTVATRFVRCDGETFLAAGLLGEPELRAYRYQGRVMGAEALQAYAPQVRRELQAALALSLDILHRQENLGRIRLRKLARQQGPLDCASAGRYAISRQAAFAAANEAGVLPGLSVANLSVSGHARSATVETAMRADALERAARRLHIDGQLEASIEQLVAAQALEPRPERTALLARWRELQAMRSDPQRLRAPEADTAQVVPVPQPVVRPQPVIEAPDPRASARRDEPVESVELVPPRDEAGRSGDRPAPPADAPPARAESAAVAPTGWTWADEFIAPPARFGLWLDTTEGRSDNVLVRGYGFTWLRGTRFAALNISQLELNRGFASRLGIGVHQAYIYGLDYGRTWDFSGDTGLLLGVYGNVAFSQGAEEEGGDLVPGLGAGAIAKVARLTFKLGYTQYFTGNDVDDEIFGEISRVVFFGFSM